MLKEFRNDLVKASKVYCELKNERDDLLCIISCVVRDVLLNQNVSDSEFRRNTIEAIKYLQNATIEHTSSTFYKKYLTIDDKEAEQG